MMTDTRIRITRERDMVALQRELDNLTESIKFTTITLNSLKKDKKNLLATLLSSSGVSNVLRREYGLGVYPQHVYAWAQVSDEPHIINGRQKHFTPGYAHRLAATKKAKAHYSDFQVSLNKRRELRKLKALEGSTV